MKNNEYKHCGLNVALTILSGKWKPMILYYISHTPEMRFTELWRIIPKITKKVLLDQLKQLEADGLILRQEKSGFPPEVSYQISEKGHALSPVLSALEEWANVHVSEKVEQFEQESGTRRWRRNGR
ncbi:helix-turn-helix transcriptional regulator [Chitinophaga agrisoli]|uniref:Helix-turn-helix transcriptional regulator n=1 Tax=Chitinophaga agrisoli TaxID=2607653 RepID=A0A5B2VLL0_9BACT|nr:helix-turn-helix domain-containing protein [Chitinophaga agrisoli]KAA2239530.1 helix-turn-helix transcriptional regulator [Chitinophaga agrisoli]